MENVEVQSQNSFDRIQSIEDELTERDLAFKREIENQLSELRSTLSTEVSSTESQIKNEIESVEQRFEDICAQYDRKNEEMLGIIKAKYEDFSQQIADYKDECMQKIEDEKHALDNNLKNADEALNERIEKSYSQASTLLDNIEEELSCLGLGSGKGIRLEIRRKTVVIPWGSHTVLSEGFGTCSLLLLILYGFDR